MSRCENSDGQSEHSKSLGLKGIGEIHSVPNGRKTLREVCGLVLYQGPTLVGPQAMQGEVGFSPCTEHRCTRRPISIEAE
jgi:hypothetical protein